MENTFGTICKYTGNKRKVICQIQNETATWPHVYQMGPPSRGASNVTEASQGVFPLPNLHNLQSIT